MAIEFTCACGKRLRAAEQYAGQKTVCPACQQQHTIPAADAATGDEVLPVEQPRRPAAPEDDSIEHRPQRKKQGVSSLVIAAIVGGVFLLLLCMVGLPVALILPAIQKVRDAADRVHSTNNLRQIATAMHAYHDDHGQLPPAVVYDKDGKPLYSWRVLLLPYLEEEALYQQFKRDEPWDSPNNIGLLAYVIPTYMTPADAKAGQFTRTHYQVFDGPGAAFDSRRQGLKPLPDNPRLFQRGAGLRLADFRDGASGTLLVVEAADAVEWTKPADLTYNPTGPLPRLGGSHADVFLAAFADGSARPLRTSLTEANLRALITRNGGEVLPDLGP